VKQPDETLATGGRRVVFGHKAISYVVEQTGRRKTIAISVDAGGVRVLAPIDLSEAEIAAVVLARAAWVLGKLELLGEAGTAIGTREFVSGEAYHYLGRAYRLRVVEEPGIGATRVRMSGRVLIAPVAAGLDDRLAKIAIRRGLRTWYEQQARRVLPERITIFAERVGVRPPSLLIRDQERRWGSCDARGRIRANWRVTTLPLRLLDYVMAHEVCHLVEPNHRGPFWRLLEVIMPDWEARRVELRNSGARYAW
jgi:predicted metal-dependent hydrolase